jgi:PadR family transcriptional regulator PadR
MRRKPGTLIPVERSILTVALYRHAAGESEFHGYAMARDMRAEGESRSLTGYGTLYRALGRLETAGLLTSRWEDADIAFAEDRPRRRLYRITALSVQALEKTAAPAPTGPGARRMAEQS